MSKVSGVTRYVARAGMLVVASVEPMEFDAGGILCCKAQAAHMRVHEFVAIFGFLPEEGKVYRAHLFSQVVVG